MIPIALSEGILLQLLVYLLNNTHDLFLKTIEHLSEPKLIFKIQGCACLGNISGPSSNVLKQHKE